MSISNLDCADCHHKLLCYRGDSGCPMSSSALLQQTIGEYRDPQMLTFSRCAALIEGEGYRLWDRPFETAEFAARMGYRHLGLAFCVAVRAEAEMYAHYLSSRSFRVSSVMCKTGGARKEAVLGVKDLEKVRPGTPEAMCNPIAQARFLADAAVDLNIIMGLCVGHDALFIQHARGPVTCLVAKDRVYDHKPIQAIRLRACGEIPAIPQGRWDTSIDRTSAAVGPGDDDC
jgi:uncharacterized metal-binding protein